MKNKIAFACDHRGFVIKGKILDFLKRKGFKVIDCGTDSDEAADYPDHIIKAAEKVRDGICQYAIGVCHTGTGSAIVANKVRGVRAALVRGVEDARLSRAHNDSNMLIFGATFIDPTLLDSILDVWLSTPFEGGRHERRVKKIKFYERRNGC